MSECYSKAIGQCLKLAEDFNLTPVKAVFDEYTSLINGGHAEITFVDLSGTPDGLIEIATSICGEDALSKVEKQLRKSSDWEAKLEYGDETAVYIGDRIPECKILDGTAVLVTPVNLVITAPVKYLEDKTICLICASSRDKAYSRFIAASDRLVLLTNATMALTSIQKNWIDTFIKERYDFDRLAVYIAHMDKLLDEKQEDEVIGYVRAYLDKFDSSKTSVLDRKTVSEYLSNDSSSLKDTAKSCTARNMIREICALIENEIKYLGMKTDEYSIISSEISRMRASFIDAGEISANNVLDNHISEIIDAISKSAEEYSEEMFESIKRTILAAKDIDDVEEKITPYMEKSWEFFAKETSRQITKDFDTINLRLTQRMETDIEDMVSKLNMDAQSVIESFVSTSDLVYIPTPDYEHASDVARKAVVRNARTLIVLSIPMLFISPTLSVATLLGGGIYSKLGKKQEDKKYRDELVDHVERACVKARKNAVESFDTTLHTEKQRMKTLVLQGYQNFLSLVLENIEQRKQNADISAKKATELAEIKADLEKQL